MNNLNVYSFSKSNVPRYVVIDHSVLLEEFVTETIGRLLGIDWKTSKVLGNAYGALGFSHKFEMIQEKVKKDKELAKKFDLFTTIRNKFAHVKSIQKWEDFFTMSSDYEKKGTQLKGWYKTEVNDENNDEDSYRLLYYYLTKELFNYLKEKTIDWATETGKLQGENFVKSELLEFIKKKSEESHHINELWNEFIDHLQSKRNKIEE